jgi:hypothetical protein
MFLIRIATILLALSNFTGVATADEAKCRVMDPTGTPLNVRTSPHGQIIGNLPNDMLVTIIDHAIDRTGKYWVYISKTFDGKPIGWVYRDFISCAD